MRPNNIEIPPIMSAPIDPIKSNFHVSTRMTSLIIPARRLLGPSILLPYTNPTAMA